MNEKGVIIIMKWDKMCIVWRKESSLLLTSLFFPSYVCYWLLAWPRMQNRVIDTIKKSFCQ